MLNRRDLLKDINSTGNSLSLKDLLAIHPDLSRRTAQRWLSSLVAEGQLEVIGKGPARRYTISPGIMLEKSPPIEFPLSPDSKDILAYVEQPVAARKPVGYQFDFLRAYEPNKTFYLSSPLRAQLQKMGNVGESIRSAGTYERAILGRLLIDLSWASSHLEGNTYSLLDTRELIEHGNKAEGKAAIETQMILNHKSAIEFLVNNIDTVRFNRHSILNLHSALSENLLGNPADEGRLRQGGVSINKSVYHPLSVPQQIEEAFTLVLAKADLIQDPFEQAFFVMVHIPYLQPFIDINKRTSRLAANISLIRHNLCPLTFLGVTEQAYTRATLGVYELTRVELLRDLFVWAYERSTQEYIAIKQELPQPDLLRLQYRDFIKQVVHDVVMSAEQDAMNYIQKRVVESVDVNNQENVRSLIVEELRRLHEGVLARYHLRISDYQRWKEKQR